ncbi:LacI family DNA-binding transcriptional regulator [Pararhizobium sp.]|uniref:LacI family DNA-binding transcriptional regulator n=1 Tax=Pararhizobium sp. TaxID=1977563 RepID=UPI002715B53D|nr:LacI family DNA-binding transcriptional regulator [Pararhizobium sp.]MDO9415064.1 LacI family DNA-binding transcriptional regulator [Pararhizobium sp.]
MVTIKEIAAAAGVSPAAVSRVLNQDPALSLSVAKRQAILEAAEALQYTTPRGRRQAAGLLSGSSDTTIALVHFLSAEAELGNPYYVAVRLGIEARLRELSLAPIQLFRNARNPDLSVLKNVSGIIVVGMHLDEELADLQTYCPNLVAADFMPGDAQLDCVTCDLGYATDILMNELGSLGYRRIGFAGGPNDAASPIATMKETRYAAYSRWMENAGLYDPDLCAISGFDAQGGYDATTTILASGSRPDVLITATDSMAIGAYRAIREKGLSIPADLAVISFNDIPAAQFLVPSLSTVKIFGEDLGAAALDLLHERLEGRDYTKRISLATKMIWRDSSRKPDPGL